MEPTTLLSHVISARPPAQPTGEQITLGATSAQVVSTQLGNMQSAERKLEAGDASVDKGKDIASNGSVRRHITLSKARNFDVERAQNYSQPTKQPELADQPMTGGPDFISGESPMTP